MGGKMAETAIDGGERYRTFISYSHRAAAFGQRLFRRLEFCALPRRLVDRTGCSGSVPQRLAPIFRDRDADHQRSEAEGIVEFMLTDLRTRLKGVGRPDVMTVVNARALTHYGNQDLSHLPADSLERRARILHAMGEDDETRGNHEAALKKFREARRTMEVLLAAAPNDPERIFNHAQSEFWIGFVEYNRGQYQKAKPAFEAYKRLADNLVLLQPQNPHFLKEEAYSEEILCSIALKPPKDPHAALRYCTSALTHMEVAARQLGYPDGAMDDLVNRFGWVSEVYRASGDMTAAFKQRESQEALLRQLMRKDPQNMAYKSEWIATQRIMAWMEYWRGDKPGAIGRMKRAAHAIDELAEFDRINARWEEQRQAIEADLMKLSNYENIRSNRQRTSLEEAGFPKPNLPTNRDVEPLPKSGSTRSNILTVT